MKTNEVRDFNYPYSQRGLNTTQAVLLKLKDSGYVSIMWEKIPKSHLKAVKEIVKNLKFEIIKETRVSSNTGYSRVIPAHINYYI